MPAFTASEASPLESTQVTVTVIGHCGLTNPCPVELPLAFEFNVRP